MTASDLTKPGDEPGDEPADEPRGASTDSETEAGLAWSRREFLEVASAGAVVGLAEVTREVPASALARRPSQTRGVPLTLDVNGVKHSLAVDPRATLLDTLRERLGLMGTKKGCDRGECGACTVHADGRRILSCMTLAVMQEGKTITTIEGLASGESLHPVQTAFIEHDAFQCGYCTPGQIMSAVACISEGHTGSATEIREWMSGNICRCSAYPNIVRAVAAAARRQP
jgi:xanthine dehydrogenase YagT iron-sulfur-binding subunit